MISAITDFILLVSGSVGLSILAKATLVLLLGLIVGAIAGRAQSSWRHLIFATTFAAVLALPLVAIAIPEVAVELETAAPVEAHSQSSTTADSPLTSSELPMIAARDAGAPSPEVWALTSVTVILFSVWITGALFLLLSLTVDLLRVRGLRRHGIPSKKLRGIIERLTIDARMKPVDVLLHEKLSAPVTFGFFNPVIMLPPIAAALIQIGPPSVSPTTG